MSLPFTTAQFHGVLADYNATVWPAQILMHVLAVACVVALLKPAEWTGRLISSFLAFFWVWMAGAYHFYFFSRNPAAWLLECHVLQRVRTLNAILKDNGDAVDSSSRGSLLRSGYRV